MATIAPQFVGSSARSSKFAIKTSCFRSKWWTGVMGDDAQRRQAASLALGEGGARRREQSFEMISDQIIKQRRCHVNRRWMKEGVFGGLV